MFTYCGKSKIFKLYKHLLKLLITFQVSQQSLLPDTICNSCFESVDNFYSFIKECLENIIILEAQYQMMESCLKTKRKVDKSVCVSDSDFVKNQISDYIKPCLNLTISDTPSTKIDTPIPNFSCSLVDYESSDNSDNEDVQTDQKTDKIKLDSRYPVKNEINTQKKSDIINEIAQRKFLKRKIDDVLPNLCKVARLETESSSRRKNKQPKKVEYHLGSKSETTLTPFLQNYASTSEETSQNSNLLPVKTEPTTLGLPDTLQSCLLCEQQFYGPVLLTSHMYETHGIDLAQVFAASQPSSSTPKKKIPELVKISDVMGAKKPLPQENYGNLFIFYIILSEVYIIFIIIQMFF